MDCISHRLPYRQTGYFTKTVLDYIDQADAIKPFFSHSPTITGIRNAIAAREQFGTDRRLLVDVLKEQYGTVETTELIKKNMEALLHPNTFTITTAHQNNVFTGPLYFIYKILHAIRLADHLRQSLNGFHFVPVFYMGSEDADLAELNHIHLNGEKLVWNTKQTGAVGRMKIDKDLVKLIGSMEGQLAVLPYGKEIVKLLKDCYQEGTALQTATFRFLNTLFGEYGLIVLLPDEARLKKKMHTLFEDDLLHQSAAGIVEKTVGKLQKAGYKVQANPREINLFYLEDNTRERIEKVNDEWRVINKEKKFRKEELLQELKEHPERFSPNVILRGLYQETILPNVAFIGGGGEMAYWLQLKELFDHYKTPFPVLVLRNSFLFIEDKWKDRISKLNFVPEDFFLPVSELLNRLVAKESKNETRLNGSMATVEQLYEEFKKQAGAVDMTLTRHVEVLKLKTVQRLQELEKKMLRAEKRKFADQQRQIQVVKDHLFPSGGLQERYENITEYYAKWGKDFISLLYNHSLALEHEFVLLTGK